MVAPEMKREPSMSDPFAPIEPGTLRTRLDAAVARALASGALQPIATREAVIEDGGVAFLVRQVDSLARKEAERRRAARPDAKRPRPANPFLPPEPDLTVGTLSDTHVAVLNKFNVLASHLLVVTRQFEDQETLLTQTDMAAVARCLMEVDGLVFYNGGTVAGASQPHKHLQLVPLPLAETGPALPMETRLPLAGLASAPTLPFAHAFAPLDGAGPESAIDPDGLYGRYRRLLERIAIRAVERDGNLWQSSPYNLLVTRRWMLAVPRQSECRRRRVRERTWLRGVPVRQGRGGTRNHPAPGSHGAAVPGRRPHERLSTPAGAKHGRVAVAIRAHTFALQPAGLRPSDRSLTEHPTCAS